MYIMEYKDHVFCSESLEDMLDPDSSSVSQPPPFLSRVQTSPASFTEGIVGGQSHQHPSRQILPPIGRSAEILDLTQVCEVSDALVFNSFNFPVYFAVSVSTALTVGARSI